MGYFGSRAAALGPVSANVVAATFYNFHPRMVARAIPDAWRLASPEQILAARYASADAALRRLLGDQIASSEIAEAARLARTAAEGCEVAGRPLFAAHAALPWPDVPHLVLWHAATLLREYRGDGRVGALMAEGVDGCEAHVTLVGTGVVPREAIQPHRGWSDEEWEVAEARLRSRGWLDAAGMLTETGRAGRQAIEDRTDRLAERPRQKLGADGSPRLHAVVCALRYAGLDTRRKPLP